MSIPLPLKIVTQTDRYEAENGANGHRQASVEGEQNLFLHQRRRW